nr:hypothetical protein [Legionella pneumophila]
MHHGTHLIQGHIAAAIDTDVKDHIACGRIQGIAAFATHNDSIFQKEEDLIAACRIQHARGCAIG